MAPSLARWSTSIVAALLLTVCACSAEEGRSGAEPETPAPPSASAPTSTAGGLDDVVAAVQERLDLYRAATHGFAVLVRVGDEKRVIVSGTADTAARRPVRRTDRFQIGSLTKTLASAAVLRLVDQGRLSLEDTVEDWLPGAPEDGGDITVEHLLSHRSGLVRTCGEFLGRRRARTTWRPRRRPGMTRGRAARFPPGTSSVYVNLNSLVLGLIVEAVHGRPPGGAPRRSSVHRPAGMREPPAAPTSSANSPPCRDTGGPRSDGCATSPRREQQVGACRRSRTSTGSGRLLGGTSLLHEMVDRR